ncbi:MAG: hypothetical protein GXX84_08655 [Acidobacteria bacterium]|nr:hypothetical protein [Acidobacteriota bacterium]
MLSKRHSFMLCLFCFLLFGNAKFSLQGADNDIPNAAVQYGSPREVARLQDENIDESSGIAASIRYEGAFWTHNDSGDSARIFLVGKDGETLATVNLKGASNRDWEDIASFKIGNEGYVLVADVGDNDKSRDDCVLYIIREPVVSGKGLTLDIEPARMIRFSYEDGPRDCEAVGIDATESTIYLVSKDRDESQIYSMPLPPESSTSPVIARRIASISLRYPNAMDVSPDGRRAVILTYGDAYEFSRADGETWAQAFSRAPLLIKAPVRKQGESICYGSDGRTLYLTSENKSQPLWEIPVVNSTE